ncbi:MAG TPA: hypothetical protein VL742_19740 [Casimicrobiaceae bacterium]|nr:hypothetical protein [Casimicrobiaceae bacterium]
MGGTSSTGIRSCSRRWSAWSWRRPGSGPLINPAEADQRQLIGAIDAALARIRAEKSSDAETQQDIDTVTRLGQTILEREWQGVKHGT